MSSSGIDRSSGGCTDRFNSGGSGCGAGDLPAVLYTCCTDPFHFFFSSRFLLPGEGRCRVALEVRRSTAAPPPPSGAKEAKEQAVLYVSRKGNTLEDPRPGELSAVENSRIEAILARGFTVVMVDVCGFGNVGDAAGDAFAAFALPNRGLYRVHLSTPVDLAFNVNRSIVAYHAGDVVRAARAVASGAEWSRAKRSKPT